MTDQGTEITLFDAQNIHRLDTADRGVSRRAGQQGHFAEILARIEFGDQLLHGLIALAGQVRRSDHLGLAADHDIHAVAQIALLEDALARLEVLLVDA